MDQPLGKPISGWGSGLGLDLHSLVWSSNWAVLVADKLVRKLFVEIETNHVENLWLKRL